VIELPTIEIRPASDLTALDAALADIARFDALVLGSKNAADVVLERAVVLGVRLDLDVACVGAKTLSYVVGEHELPRAFERTSARAERAPRRSARRDAARGSEQEARAVSARGGRS
jgi:uroporphyrinogen-III synthase